MAAKQLSQGDTVGLTAEVTMVHDDGTVTVNLHGYVYPLTLPARASIPYREIQEARQAKLRRALMQERRKPTDWTEYTEGALPPPAGALILVRFRDRLESKAAEPAHAV